jgi:DNA polymerase-3 subunit epsilon
VTGLTSLPTGTLVDRAIGYLQEGPADSVAIAHNVLGLRSASRAVAERVTVALLGAHPRVRRLPDSRWDLVAFSGGSPALDACTFAVVDVETTGTRPRSGDRIIEIAIATVTNGRAELALDRLVNPECPIPTFTRRLTGITDDMVRDKQVFGEIANDVVAALAGRVFVAHNMRFDWAFVSAEVHRSLDTVLDGPRICTVKLARRLVPGLRRRNLESLATYFGVEIEARHRAGGDALAAAGILVRLLELGALVSYHDPWIPEAEIDARIHKSVALTDEALREADLVVITTAHSNVDYGRVTRLAPRVLDTRNATAGLDRLPHVERL